VKNFTVNKPAVLTALVLASVSGCGTFSGEGARRKLTSTASWYRGTSFFSSARLCCAPGSRFLNASFYTKASLAAHQHQNQPVSRRRRSPYHRVQTCDSATPVSWKGLKHLLHHVWMKDIYLHALHHDRHPYRLLHHRLPPTTIATAIGIVGCYCTTKISSTVG
jgi:hypothetical protein